MMISKNSRMPALKKRKLWLRKPSEKSSNARKLPPPRRPLRKRPRTRIRLLNKKFRIRLPKKPRRRLEVRERNDQPSYLNYIVVISKFKYWTIRI